jgi:hypothetical protein
MDPKVRSLFDEVLKRIDDLHTDSSGRWEWWERRFEEATAELQERDAAVDRRIKSLEEYASSQYTTAVIADNWGPTSTSESLTSSSGWWISS